MAILKKISRLHSHVTWKDFVRSYLFKRYGEAGEFEFNTVSEVAIFVGR